MNKNPFCDKIFTLKRKDFLFQNVKAFTSFGLFLNGSYLKLLSNKQEVSEVSLHTACSNVLTTSFIIALRKDS